MGATTVARFDQYRHVSFLERPNSFATRFPRSQTTARRAATCFPEPTFSSGTPELLFSLRGYEFAGSPGRRFDIAPDGDRFIFRQGNVTAQTGDDETFDGLILVLNWFQELTDRVPTRRRCLYNLALHSAPMRAKPGRQ